MKTSFLILLVGAIACQADYDPRSYVDRKCGQDLGNLWLDIVAVVDNSHGMTDDGLGDVAATLCTIVSSGTRIGTNYTDARSTRLALVTYNSQASTNADLNKFQNLDDVYNNVYPALSSVAKTDNSFLANGLAMAEQVFDDGEVGNFRANYKKAVIVFASSYQKSGDFDPVHVAERMKSSGIKIITVAYDRGDGALLKELGNIASPRYNFTNKEDGLLENIQQALLEINCFCPNDWVQYRTSFTDISSAPFGICVQPITIAANWRAAQMNCRNRKEGNAYLVTEFNQAKHDFVLQAVRNASGSAQPYIYHIGLNMISGQWIWDQPATWPQPALQNWTGWAPNYPVASSSMSAVQNVQSGYQTVWQNTGLYTSGNKYVCETYTCDTDKYCVAQLD
uniref:VWFA domain-containing protein n=1 Tax=Caenorhabditis tropicalis TaxID=1561998 RepID=A0A1I7UTF7_9PELO